MKAWRRYNSGLARIKYTLIKLRAFQLAIGYDPKHPEIQILNQRINDCNANKIKQSQRPYQMKPEQSQPSGLLYVLFAKSGLQLPDAVTDMLTSIRNSSVHTMEISGLAVSRNSISNSEFRSPPSPTTI